MKPSSDWVTKDWVTKDWVTKNWVTKDWVSPEARRTARSRKAELAASAWNGRSSVVTLPERGSMVASEVTARR